MKYIALMILSLVAAVPAPYGDDDFCESTITQKVGAVLALQDPRKACNHNHGLAHLGLQRDAGANSKTSEGADFLYLNRGIEGFTNAVGLGVSKPSKSHGASKKSKRKVTKKPRRKTSNKYMRSSGRRPVKRKVKHSGH